MRIAFASPYAVLDSSSGASVATLDASASISGPTVTTHAFCSAHGDSPHELLPEEWLAESGLYYEVTRNSHFSIIHTESRGVRIDMFRTESTCRRWTGADEIRRFLAAFDCFLEAFRPDVLITYGGDEVSLAMMRMVKARGCLVLRTGHAPRWNERGRLSRINVRRKSGGRKVGRPVWSHVDGIEN